MLLIIFSYVVLYNLGFNCKYSEFHNALNDNGYTQWTLTGLLFNAQVVDALLEAGARVNEVDNDGRIPLILGAQEGHLSVVTTLADAGSMLEAKSHDGRTALRTAALEGHQDVVHSLLCRKNIDVNYRDADGRSTLYMLALDNRLSMAALLLDHGADVEGCDFEGRTPLHVATWQGHYEMVELLLGRGANPDAVDHDRRTAIQSAAWQGRHEVVRLLVENGATVDHTCNQGATALCIAAQEGHDQVVGVLLQHGANPSHVDQCGRTPFRVASKGGHSGVVRLLKEYSGCATMTQNGASCPRRSCGAALAPSNSAFTLDAKYSNSTSQALANARAIANGHIATSSSSGGDWPGSADPKYSSVNSRFSQNNPLSLNSLSTTRSSSSSGAESGVALMSFTQQLQQCSDARRRNRSSNQAALSPVHEPPPLAHSPGSPLSEVHSCKASPAFGSPVYDVVGKLSVPPPQGDRVAGQDEMVIEPIWQRQLERSRSRPNRMGAMVMGQTALVMNSPELRRKRNGIITNPGGSPTAPDVVGGATSSQSSGGSFGNMAGSQEFPKMEGTKKETGSSSKASRPSGLALKRETPL